MFKEEVRKPRKERNLPTSFLHSTEKVNADVMQQVAILQSRLYHTDIETRWNRETLQSFEMRLAQVASQRLSRSAPMSTRMQAIEQDSARLRARLASVESTARGQGDSDGAVAGNPRPVSESVGEVPGWRPSVGDTDDTVGSVTGCDRPRRTPGWSPSLWNR